jgi:hypothetical protein
VNATTHVLEFDTGFDTADSFEFNFWVLSLYEDPATGQIYDTDDAPDDGLWTYNFRVTPDYDHDGLVGLEDKCPHVAAGRYDSNKNGCPGPFGQINAIFHYNYKTFGTGLSLTRLSFSAMPPGATLVLSYGSSRETLRAKGNGSAASRAFLRSLPSGATIVARATKAGFVGDYLQLRVIKSGLLVVKRLCIPASGNGAPRRCTRSLKGS